ncbi:MAG: cupin domain-containing protein [Bryobacteraceae bacterium]
MKSYNWDTVPKEQLNPLLARQVINTPQMTLMRLTFRKGALVPTHQHVHEQVSAVTSGALRFEMNGEEMTLRAGDVLVIPSSAPHLAEAMEDTVSLDVFTPAREDLVRNG